MAIYQGYHIQSTNRPWQNKGPKPDFSLKGELLIKLMHSFGPLSRQVGDFQNRQQGVLQRHNLLCLPTRKVYRLWRNKGPKLYINL